MLDVPIVNMFDTSFAEHHPEETQPVSRPEGTRSRDTARACCPSSTRHRGRLLQPSTIRHSRSREALDQLSRNGAIDACHGVKMR